MNFDPALFTETSPGQYELTREGRRRATMALDRAMKGRLLTELDRVLLTHVNMIWKLYTDHLS